MSQTDQPPIRDRHFTRDVVLMSEIARALGMKRSSAYIAARAGELPVEFVAGRYEMSRDVLNRLARERASTETAAA